MSRLSIYFLIGGAAAQVPLHWTAHPTYVFDVDSFDTPIPPKPVMIWNRPKNGFNGNEFFDIVHPTPNQNWTMIKWTGHNWHLCLQAAEVSNGAPIHVDICDNAKATQRWELAKTTYGVKIMSAGNNAFCVNVKNAPDGAKNGQRLEVWECNNDQLQSFMGVGAEPRPQPPKPPTPPQPSTKKQELCSSFVAFQSCSDDIWEGVFKDMFSPDDKNPDSRRFIDLNRTDDTLQVSADTGDEKWGRRFDKTTSINPIVEPSGNPCVAKISFLSKVPTDAPIYPEAQAGALNFTLVMGVALGNKVIKWNGMYDGKGGIFNGESVPPSSCDNFWKVIGVNSGITLV